MMRWKKQNADLVAKHEADQVLTKGLYKLSTLLKDEFFAAEEAREGILSNIIELAHVSTSLLIQEEKDKKDISLVGMKERDNQVSSPTRARGCQHVKSPILGSIPHNQVLDFDHKCQSCHCASAAERTVLFQSFKMACLAYKPTAVTMLDGSVIARQDAVELQSRISENLDTIQATKNERQK